MAWGISVRNLCRIHSFRQAEEHWGKQKEWKNERTSWRPLTGRRERHKRLVQQDYGCNYACTLYETALVTYYADGSVALKTYDTPSSITFAGCVSPQGCYPIFHKGRMFWRVLTDDGMRYYTEGDKPLLLVLTKKGNWHLTNQPAELKQRVYDRKKGAEVQKRLKPYVDWYRLTDRLGGFPQGHFPVSLVAGTDSSVRAQELIATPEKFMTLALTYGPPEKIRPALYEAVGAYYKVSVPHTSLPKDLA